MKTKIKKNPENPLAPRRKAIRPELPPVSDFEHVMVDLETLGRRPGCALLSIGAVAFNAKQLGPELYLVVEREGQLGLHEDPETITWWGKQSDEARQVFVNPNRLVLMEALGAFTNYLDQFGLSRVKVWGNGADFDNAILICAYAAIGQSIPWMFWHNRCYRTLKGLVPEPRAQRQGTYHHALDDAKTQALHAIDLLAKLRS